MLSESAGALDATTYPNRRYAWYVAAVLTLCYAVASVDRLILGLLTPAILTDLHLSDTQGGLINGMAFFMFYTLFGLPIAWLVDRSNRRRILSVGILAWSAMSAVGSLATGFGSLFAARVGVGIGEASLNPSATSILSDYFPEESRSKAFGLYGGGSALGSIMAFTGGGAIYRWLQAQPQLVLPLVGILAPWKTMLIVVGLPGLITAPLLYFTVREPPRRKRLSAGAPPKAAALLRFLSQNRFTILTHHLGIALIMAPMYAMFTWLPTFFLRVHHWTPADFSVAFGIPAGVLGMSGALSAGFLATRLKRRGDPLGTLRACVIGSVCSVAGHILAPLVPDPKLCLIAILATGVFSTYPIVLGFSAITEVVPNEMRARFTASLILCTGLISATLGPLLVGLISDAMPDNPRGIAIAIVTIASVLGAPGVLLLAIGLKPFRQSLLRAAAGDALTA